MNFAVDQVVDNIRVIDAKRNYWFIRTYSGALYRNFFEKSFVGIGFNAIPMGLIKKASNLGDGNLSPLKAAIENAYDLKLGEVTKAANQLIDFHQNVKAGDMVIMPSENSDEFAFGLVEGNIYQSQSKGTFKFRDGYEPFPEKRRKVRWLKTLDKRELNGDFRNLITTRAAITNADLYKDIIEGHLSSVYIREDKLFLTIQIEQEEDINAFAFNDFLTGLTYFYSEFCKENGEDYNEELYLKIKVQSRGMVALKCASIVAGVGLTGLILLSDNPEAKLQLFDWVKIEGKSDGFLSSISKFKDASQERRHREEKFQDSIKRLKATTVSEPINKQEDSINIDTLNKGLNSPHFEKTSKEDNILATSRKQIQPGSQREKGDGNHKSDN